MPVKSKFTLSRAAHWCAQALLAAAITSSLKDFLTLWIAVPLATTLTFVFGELVRLAMSPSAWWQRVAAMIGALMIGSTSVALSYSTAYQRFFATPSAILDFTSRREPAERELQRVLGLAQTAQSALQTWAQDAAEKARIESTDGAAGGGTCPSRPESLGRRGPITTWRSDDARVAGSLAADLKGLLDRAAAGTQTLTALPKPKDFAEVKLGMDLANKALDDIARLTGGGNFAQSTIKALQDREASMVTIRTGETVGCGDGARLALIDRAKAALETLAATKPPPRLQATVDLADPQDVLTRGWLRGFNGALSMATLGHAGQFTDDPLMLQALKNGLVNRETVGFLLAVLLEASVVFTALVLARQGRAPFGDNLPDWIRAAESRNGTPGPVRRGLMGAAKRVANAFYAEPEAPASGTAVQVLDARLDSASFGDVELNAEPRYPARETRWSSELLDFHFPWGADDYLIVPVLPTTRRVRSMAHSLRAQGVLDFITESADHRLLAGKRDALRYMQGKLGDTWQDVDYAVFRIKPAYAHVLRLTLIDSQPPQSLPPQPTQPCSSQHPPAGSVSRSPHQSLRRRIAARNQQVR